MPSLLKTMLVKEIEQRIGSASALVLLGVAKLESKQETEIRMNAAKLGIRMFRVRNNLASLVFHKQGRQSLDSYLSGTTIVAYSDDPVSLSKFCKELSETKEYAEKLELRGGWMLNKNLPAAHVVALADMPPYEQMVATFLATVSSPVTNLLSTLTAPMSNLLNVLEQVRDSKQESQAS